MSFKILFKKLSASYIFVSNNFRFGNRREGDVNLLKRFQKKYNYKLINPKPLYKKNKIISSTLIRKLIENGNLKAANQLLSKNWSVEGVVEKGRMMGRKIGFPTCNINIKNYVIPKVGVYAVDVYIEKNRKKIKGIANIGYRPTFNQKKLLLEVNLFKFSGNLYNKNLTINFTKFIRGETKFKNIDALKKQIKKDITIGKTYLISNSKENDLKAIEFSTVPPSSVVSIKNSPLCAKDLIPYFQDQFPEHSEIWLNSEVVS